MAFSLDLNQIRGPREHVERVFPASAFASADEDYRVVGDVALAFAVEKLERSQVRLVGTLRSTLEVPCGRCLETIAWPVDAAFDLRYLPATLNQAAEEEEVAAEDLGVAFYEGERIDLEQLIREQFLLALPMKALCRPDCQGLCPECGTNLNTSRCDCDHRWVDPRLAALEQLLPKRSR